MSNPLEDNADGVRFVYKHLIAAVILTVVGFALTVALATILKSLKEDFHILHVIFEHLATALTIAGLWHIISEFMMKRDFIRIGNKVVQEFIESSRQDKAQIIQSISNARKDSKLGLIDTYHDVSAFSYSEFIAHPAELTIVLGDGYSWVSMHLDVLRDRVCDPSKTTKLFIIDPGSPAMDLVAKKMRMKADLYRDRALLTIETLRRELIPGSKFTIFGHPSIPHHAVYLGDRLAITPYFFSTKKRSPPVFVFEKGSYVSRVQADLSELEKESTILLCSEKMDSARGAEQAVSADVPASASLQQSRDRT